MFLIKLISENRNYFSIGKDYTNALSIIVHSDTLFSAICNNFRKLYGKIELKDEFLDKMKPEQEEKGINFQISSCFHFLDIYKQSKLIDTIYFLPRPLIKFPLDDESQKYLEANPKLLKKVKFISFEVTNRLKQKEKITISQFHLLDDKYLIDSKELEKLGLSEFLSLRMSSDPKKEKIYRVIKKKIVIFEILDEQKVRISRKTGKSEPFTWSKFKFETSSYFIYEDGKKLEYKLIPGFYFFLNYSDVNDKLETKIKASIQLIKDEGLGGKRSIGCGLVDKIEFLPINQNFPYFNLFEEKNSDKFINLSLVYPSKDEIQNVVFFNLFGRSGFVYSLDNRSVRFKDVKFIEEGSIFASKIPGNLVDVASKSFRENYHSVYKNGIGFYLNLGDIEVD